ncbi:MAG: glycine--tRNA ligase subunit beta [Anaerolineae bacterium]|nr:glycine--tRNA ligase subunit beta [Anaerolineae bacterium]
MLQPLNFQQVILKLHEYWAAQGCVIWEPYNVQVGAGTGNPATLLRVLGPEPWRVAYVEPSVRPDDGRYGDNPNRMQKYYQYQVILKPDPGNPQELYLKSLEALGINPREHDIRFVEDNWESPALGAWGLGWEVWLDGQEITQFTYFQQAGGMELDPVSVEITYGVERIVLALQNKNSAWEIDWMEGITYHDIMYQEEVEHCRYYFDVADVDALKQVYDAYEREYSRALEGDALISAYDYVLKCSHLFNVLDTRGAIGVTERASYFRRMRDMTRTIAHAYAENRTELGHPLMSMLSKWGVPLPEYAAIEPAAPTQPADFLFEIGVEELPASDVDDVLQQLETAFPALLDDLRLSYANVSVDATPRRIVVRAKNLAARQTDEEFVAKGPPAERAYDADGNPTKAAMGFARGRGVDVADLQVQEIDGGQYVTAVVHNEGRPATHVLQEALPKLIAGIKFGKAMRWNETGIAFSRPVRWLLALFGDIAIPFAYAGVVSGQSTRGLRPYGSPELAVSNPADYQSTLKEQGIILNREARRTEIAKQIKSLADEIDGVIPDDPGLLDEVTNLVEAPVALRGTFEEKYLALPREVLVMVMRKHQRYFPVEHGTDQLLPYFIAVRNGDEEHLDKVVHGNEHVLRARFSDADYFYNQDIKKPLKDYLERLSTLTFQEHLGSMRDKNERIVSTVEPIGKLLGADATSIGIAQRASHIAKADLGTQIVVEMTSLQGTMGREYAKREDYPIEVANAIFEHWQPRYAGDAVPASMAGTILAVADKLDSLVGLFAAGLAPRSTSDPYGLRRAALGIVQILVAKQLDVNLRDAIELAAPSQPIEVTPFVTSQLLEFIQGRLDSWLEEELAAPRDVINAVLAQQGNNPYRAYIGVQQLAEWVQRENWPTLLDNFARCVRITRSEDQTFKVDAGLFQEDAEKALFDAVQAAKATMGEDANVDGFLTAFEPVVPAIQQFFDAVLVNAEDETVRQNRLGLLQSISRMARGRADLSELAGF